MLIIDFLCRFSFSFRYVHSRLRRWKMWVTAFNQGTALVLILTRLLAEQARAHQEDTVRFATDADKREKPVIVNAALAFMYISTFASILQFVVLFGECQAVVFKQMM